MVVGFRVWTRCGYRLEGRFVFWVVEGDIIFTKDLYRHLGASFRNV